MTSATVNRVEFLDTPRGEVLLAHWTTPRGSASGTFPSIEAFREYFAGTAVEYESGSVEMMIDDFASPDCDNYWRDLYWQDVEDLLDLSDE